jgi:hypothetical protein
MKTALVAALVGASLLASAYAEAQAPAPTRIRGTISAVSGDVLAVNGIDGKKIDIVVGDKTSIVFAQPIPIAEIKPGDFLGVTSVKRNDGTLTAYDVRRFPKPVNPGHRPFDGGDNQTMTNAAVSANVEATKGRELVLSYEGGSQTVVVADSAAITSLVPGQRAQLVPGSYVNLTAAPESDGKLTARNIEVRKDAPKAPR